MSAVPSLSQCNAFIVLYRELKASGLEVMPLDCIRLNLTICVYFHYLFYEMTNFKWFNLLSF